MSKPTINRNGTFGDIHKTKNTYNWNIHENVTKLTVKEMQINTEIRYNY